MAKVKRFTRRWKGFSEKEVSERMKALAQNRFKTPEEKAAHVRHMVEARGKTWKIIKGKRVYVGNKSK